MLFRFRIHFPNLLRIDAGGLFTHDVDTAAEAFHGITGMIVMGNGNDACFNQPAVQHGDRVLKVSNVRGNVLPGPVETGRIDVGNGRYLNLGHPVFPYETAGIGGSLISDADDAKLYLFSHTAFPPFLSRGWIYTFIIPDPEEEKQQVFAETTKPGGRGRLSENKSCEAGRVDIK